METTVLWNQSCTTDNTKCLTSQKLMLNSLIARIA